CLAAEVGLPGAALALLAAVVMVAELAEFAAARAHAPARHGARAWLGGLADLPIFVPGAVLTDRILLFPRGDCRLLAAPFGRVADLFLFAFHAVLLRLLGKTTRGGAPPFRRRAQEKGRRSRGLAASLALQKRGF